MIKKTFELLRRHSGHAKNASLYFMVTIITAIAYLAINPLMSMFMSAEDYTIIGYYNSFSLLLLPLLNFSLTTYYSRKYFFVETEQRVVVMDTLLRMMLILGGIGVPLVGAGFVVYFLSTGISIPIFPFFIFVLFSTFLNNFLIMLQVKYRMEREAKKYFNITLISTGITIILSILLVTIFKFGAGGYLVAPVIGSFLIGIYCYKKLFSGTRFDKTVMFDALKFCWPLALSSLLWYFISGVDRAILEPLGNIEEFALYSVAISIASRLNLIYSALSQTFQPDIFKAIADNNVRRVLGFSAIILICVIIVNLLFIPFSEFIIKILTADRYTQAYKYANIFVIGNIATAIYYSLINIIVGLGYTKYELAIRAIGAVLCIFIYRVLISHYQFVGGAWGQVICFLTMSLLATSFILVKLKINKSNGN